MNQRRQILEECTDDANLKWSRVTNLHTKFFNFMGAFPNNKIASNKLKSAIYNIYFVLAILTKLPLVIMVSLNLMDIGGNIAAISDTLFLSMSFSLDGFIGAYYLLNRNKLIKIFGQTEVSVLRNLEKIAGSKKYREIVNQDSRKCKIQISILIAWLTILNVAWIILPTVFIFIPHLLRDHESQNETSYVMLLPVWLPEDLKKPPITDIAFMIQAFDTYTGMMFTASFNILFLFVTSYATTRFKLLAYSIENVDFRRWMRKDSLEAKKRLSVDTIGDAVENPQVVEEITAVTHSTNIRMEIYSSLRDTEADVSVVDEQKILQYLKIWVKEHENLLE